MMSVGTPMVGGGGGSVGGGAGVFVAGTGVFVRGTEVCLGLRRVEVGAKVETPVAVSPGWRVRRVGVNGNVAVGDGVRVAEGVGVGMVEVMVGVPEGVCVGTVEVGNGPSRASEVSASAVLVPATPQNAPACMPGPRKANQIHRIVAIKKASNPILRRFD